VEAATVFSGLEFLAVGHVTNDVTAAGVVPGGSALYSVLAARALGARATLVTSFAGDFTGARLVAGAGVTVERVPSAATTTFENVYSAGGRRTQRVHAVATRLPSGDAIAADVSLTCPVADEVDVAAPRAGLVGACLQGWLRRLDANGRVHARPLPDPAALAGFDTLIASEEDLAADAALRTRLPALARREALITAGARGARLHAAGAARRVLPFPARQIDPTGAGDVFATVFLLARASGRDAAAAAELAACAGAIAVEAVGPTGLQALATLPARSRR
jgi:hypothetical protein